MNNFTICGTKLEDIQQKLLVILDEIDRVCKKNKVDYFLSGGTLLGAVRHKGFIPWDNDIDLWMTRKNYSKFLKACKKDLGDNFFVENYHRNIHCPYAFTKIEMKNTIFIERELLGTKAGQCLYIDVFPLDNIAKPFYKIQTAILIKLQSIRNFKLLNHKKSEYPKIKRFFYSLVPLRLCRFITEFNLRFFNIFRLKNVNQLCHAGRHWPIFYRPDIENLVDITFCEKLYPAPKNHDKILTQCYGSYMELPPIDKRQPAHDIIECSLDIKK